MKQKLISLFGMGCLLILLSGCGELNQLLSKVNELLDGQSEEAEADGQQSIPVNFQEDGEEQEEEQDNNTGLQSGTVQEKNDNLFFDDLLLSQGYTFKELPNGFPFTLPYHWILVDENFESYTAENVEATFCFNMPVDIEYVADLVTIEGQVDQKHYGTNEKIIHVTTFQTENEFENLEGTFTYYLDDFQNTCVDLVMNHPFYIGEDEHYGGDPSTMISEEELADFGAREDDEEEQIVERNRELPQYYDTWMDALIESDNLREVHATTPSIIDRFKNGNLLYYTIEQGQPKIFPYEWHLVDLGQNFANGSWAGMYCTDAPIGETVQKHQHMLAKYQADITDFRVNDWAELGEISRAEFAFNDEFGTGSWQGRTSVHIPYEIPLEGHVCVEVNMKFSDDIIN